MLSWDEFYNEDAPVKKEEQKQPEPRVAEATQAEATPQEKAVEQTTQEPLVTEDISSPAMQNVENYTTMKNPTEAELQKVRERMDKVLEGRVQVGQKAFCPTCTLPSRTLSILSLTFCNSASVGFFMVV